MRQIVISTEIFSLIWSKRRPPEETEDEILARILRDDDPKRSVPLRPPHAPLAEAIEVKSSGEEISCNKLVELEKQVFGKVRWVDDVSNALTRLGGQASLHAIYREVERIRQAAGRSVPKTLDAVIRRTLEDHSSDSANFRGVDLFTLPEGHGKGVWAIRPLTDLLR